MVVCCLDWWVLEIMVLLAGLAGADAELQVPRGWYAWVHLLLNLSASMPPLTYEMLTSFLCEWSRWLRWESFSMPSASFST